MKIYCDVWLNSIIKQVKLLQKSLPQRSQLQFHWRPWWWTTLKLTWGEMSLRRSCFSVFSSTAKCMYVCGWFSPVTWLTKMAINQRWLQVIANNYSPHRHDGEEILWQNIKLVNNSETEREYLVMESKKISNDQELIQSDPISCPQNQKGNN